MRGWMLIAVLGLAACGENQGWNPNYMWDSGRYSDYRVQRELALVNNGASPEVIPVVLPTQAPTGADIAGTTPVAAPPSKGLVVGADGRATRIQPKVAAPKSGQPTELVPPELQGTDGYGAGTGRAASPRL
ncbi:hypothetical protein [Paracoccus sp. (in: a-proteobacteria)]|uniref:hypothetical protein n=1 Tax=Paracoccus sp. TaxID=267 RepID=UPI003A88C9A0